MSAYKHLQTLLTPYVSSKLTKLRYGGMNDGGYIFSKEIVDSSNVVLSYGIGTEKENVEFDLQMGNLGKKIYMRDGSVESPPVNHENFIFESLFCNYENFDQQVNILKEFNLIAQIDIEGSEYDMLSFCKEETLNALPQFSVEFHELLLENIWNTKVESDIKDDMERKISCFEKVLKTHHVYHLHGNNHSYNGPIPNSLEITFVKKDVVEDLHIDMTEYPICFLDYPCNSDREDYKLNWWIK